MSTPMDVLGASLTGAAILAFVIVFWRFSEVSRHRTQVSLEREKAQLEKELVRSERMTAIGRLGGRPREGERRARDEPDDDDEPEGYTVHPILEQVLSGGGVDIQAALQLDLGELAKVFAMKDTLLSEIKRLGGGRGLPAPGPEVGEGFI